MKRSRSGSTKLAAMGIETVVERDRIAYFRGDRRTVSRSNYRKRGRRRIRTCRSIHGFMMYYYILSRVRIVRSPFFSFLPFSSDFHSKRIQHLPPPREETTNLELQLSCFPEKRRGKEFSRSIIELARTLVIGLVAGRLGIPKSSRETLSPGQDTRCIRRNR